MLNSQNNVLHKESNNFAVSNNVCELALVYLNFTQNNHTKRTYHTRHKIIYGFSMTYQKYQHNSNHTVFILQTTTYLSYNCSNSEKQRIIRMRIRTGVSLSYW